MVMADSMIIAAPSSGWPRLGADREQWNRMSLMNTERGGAFAADRAIEEYAKDIGTQEERRNKRFP